MHIYELNGVKRSLSLSLNGHHKRSKCDKHSLTQNFGEILNCYIKKVREGNPSLTGVNFDHEEPLYPLHIHSSCKG